MARGPLLGWPNLCTCADGQRFARMARGGLEDWAGLKARQEEKKWRLHNLEANCKTLHRVDTGCIVQQSRAVSWRHGGLIK